MDELGLTLLLAATVSSGILAGTFLLYAHTVMPALRGADDEEFVRTFARLDRAILNPVFLVTGFLGAPLLTLGALVVVDERGWVAAALVLHLVMVLITGAVNVPRNDALKAAPPDSDPRDVRRDFDEARWARWNWVRVVLSTLATCLLAGALASG